MTYAASTDVELEVGGVANLAALTSQTGGDTPDAGVVGAALAEADALINSYASKRFAVPFASSPLVITQLAARIAARSLRRRRSMVLQSDLEDEKTDRKWLEDLAAGKVLPGVEPLPERGSIVTDKAVERESTKNVSRNALKGYW